MRPLGHAQQPPNPEVPAATRTVNLTLEQRHVIRELVSELKVAAGRRTTRWRPATPSPARSSCSPIPPLIGQKVPQIKSHRFYVTREQIVIVDPQEQRVVEVIE